MQDLQAHARMLVLLAREECNTRKMIALRKAAQQISQHLARALRYPPEGALWERLRARHIKLAELASKHAPVPPRIGADELEACLTSKPRDGGVNTRRAHYIAQIARLGRLRRRAAAAARAGVEGAESELAEIDEGIEAVRVAHKETR